MKVLLAYDGLSHSENALATAAERTRSGDRDDDPERGAARRPRVEVRRPRRPASPCARGRRGPTRTFASWASSPRCRWSTATRSARSCGSPRRAGTTSSSRARAVETPSGSCSARQRVESARPRGAVRRARRREGRVVPLRARPRLGEREIRPAPRPRAAPAPRNRRRFGSRRSCPSARPAEQAVGEGERVRHLVEGLGKPPASGSQGPVPRQR